MSEATVRCPKCGHEGIIVTELLNSDLQLIADSLEAENQKLKELLGQLRDPECWADEDAAADEIERLEAENQKLRSLLNNRAGKLLHKGKYFLCVAIDEPYFSHVYELIRVHERQHGRWTDEDEQIYRQRMNQWAKGNQAESEVSDE